MIKYNYHYLITAKEYLILGIIHSKFFSCFLPKCLRFLNFSETFPKKIDLIYYFLNLYYYLINPNLILDHLYH